MAGLLLASGPAALGLAAPAAGVLSDRIGPRPVILAGLAVMLAGYLLMSTLSAETSPLGYVLIGIPVGLGLGIFQSPNNGAIMGSVPRHRLGVTSGSLTITRISGQLSGVSILGAVWATRVASHWSAVDGRGPAPPSAQVAALRDTLLVVATLIGISLALAVWALVADSGRSTTR